MWPPCTLAADQHEPLSCLKLTQVNGQLVTLSGVVRAEAAIDSWRRGGGAGSSWCATRRVRLTAAGMVRVPDAVLSSLYVMHRRLPKSLHLFPGGTTCEVDPLRYPLTAACRLTRLHHGEQRCRDAPEATRRLGPAYNSTRMNYERKSPRSAKHATGSSARSRIWGLMCTSNPTELAPHMHINADLVLLTITTCDTSANTTRIVAVAAL